MANTNPITLEQLFRFFDKNLPHQLAAIMELEADLATNGYAVAMRRDRPWFKTWSQAGKQQETANTWDGVQASAQRAGARYPELVAAQWALESGYGKTPSGRNNYWGLKGSGTAKPTQEVVNGKTIDIVASFLDFDSIDEGVEYLVSRWYKDFKSYKGVNNASTRDDAARQLQREGYATDPAYASKLIALMNQHAAPSPAVAPYLRLTRSGKRDARGLELLRLERVRSGQAVASLQVVSGAPGAQTFRKGADSKAGSLEPLPEGLWSVGGAEWAGGVGNYSASWGPGLGAVWVPLEYRAPGATSRSAIGAHLDSNATVAPGSAGCVVFRSLADLRTFVAWMQADAPRELYVDWNLGTCPAPKS